VICPGPPAGNCAGDPRRLIAAFDRVSPEPDVPPGAGLSGSPPAMRRCSAIQRPHPSPISVTGMLHLERVYLHEEEVAAAASRNSTVPAPS